MIYPDISVSIDNPLFLEIKLNDLAPLPSIQWECGGYRKQDIMSIRLCTKTNPNYVEIILSDNTQYQLYYYAQVGGGPYNSFPIQSISGVNIIDTADLYHKLLSIA